VTINENSLFDIHVKRIHEYKRQIMNILYVIYRYLAIKEMTPEQRKNVVPRTVMFAGKAAPAYTVAKQIIKLVSNVSAVVNNDDQTKGFLKVLFLPTTTSRMQRSSFQLQTLVSISPQQGLKPREPAT